MSSIIFFPLLLVVFSLYNYVYSYYKNVKPEILIIITTLLFSFIFGCRVNFGIDHPVYFDMYVNQTAGLLRCEPIFVFISKLFYRFNTPYQIYFTFLSFLQIFFLILGCKRLNINYSCAFFIFFSTEIFYYMNVIRQAIAMSMIFYAYSLLVTDKKKSFFLVVLIASGFHKSSLISFLFSLYPVFNKKIRYEWLYYIPLFLILVFYTKVNTVITNILTYLSKIFLGGFASQVIGAFMTHQIALGSGLGVKLRILMYILMLPKFLECAKGDNIYKFLFLIFYIGLLGELYMSLNMNLVRLFWYGSIVQIAIIPMTFSKVYLKEIYDIKNILFILGILILIFLFIVNSNNGIMDTKFYSIDLDFTFKKRFPL